MPINKLIFLVTFSLAVSCQIESNISKMKKLSSQALIENAEVLSDEEGVKVMKMSSDSDEALLVTASEQSSLGSSRAVFTPGSFSVDSEVTLEEGVGLIDDESKVNLGITSEFTPSSRPLTISSSSEISTPQPMAISLQIDQSLQITADDNAALYVAVYLIKLGELTKMGVIVTADIQVLDGAAEFEFSAPGKFTKVSFQLAKIATPIEVAKEVESNKKHKTLREKKNEEQDPGKSDEQEPSRSQLPVASGEPVSPAPVQPPVAPVLPASPAEDLTVGSATDQTSETAPSPDPDTTPPSGASIVIAGGALSTNIETTNLTLTALEASEMYISNQQGCAGGGIWENYATSKASWILGQSNATATVYVKFRDASQNETDCVSDTIIHDNLAPSSASIAIGSSEFANTSAIALTLTAIDASEMYVTNTATCALGGLWEPYSSVKSGWMLAQLNATATVFAKFRDEAGNETSCVNDTVVHDDVPPTGGSISIDGGSATNLSDVVLSLSALGAVDMYVTNTAGCASGGAFESFVTSKSAWPLGQTNSTATVYVKYKDAAGNETACLNDTIIHDSLAPTGVSLSIASGDYTSLTSPGLFPNATDASEMYITNTAGCAGGGTWEVYTANKSGWVLAQTNATATVFAKYRDLAGNTSACVNDTIVHDDILPTQSGVVSDQETTHLANLSPEISWTPGNDSGSGISGYEVSIGSAIASSDIKSWTDVGDTASTQFTDLSLSWGSTYFASVRAVDHANNYGVQIDSDGFLFGFLQQAYLKASNTDSDDLFGRSVAISGDTIVVGVPGESSNATGVANGSTASADNSSSDAGAAFVFKRSGKNWTQEAYLKAPIADAGDGFGTSVAISGDTIVVGALNEDSNGTLVVNGGGGGANNSSSDSGAAYVFKRSGSNWAQEAYLKASNSGAGDEFASVVAISGETIVVGAFKEDSNQMTITNGAIASSNNSATDSGAVYVFKRSGSTWVEEAYLKATQVDSNDFYGKAIAISGDTVVVGAIGEASSDNVISNGNAGSVDNSKSRSGAVYVYKRTGNVWAQESYIKAKNNGANDDFGISVAISGDRIVVGATREDSNQTTVTNGISASADDSSSSSGAAYIYKRTGSSWAQEAYLKSSNSDSDDKFGSAVGISGDLVVVTSSGEDSYSSTIDNTGSASTDNSMSEAGAIYVFRLDGANWLEQSYLKPANPEASDIFGGSVAISAESIVSGSFGEDSNQNGVTNSSQASSDNSSSDAGAVYVFDM